MPERFTKGGPPGPGRPKGSGKKITKRTLAEICNGWHPIDELLKLLPEIKSKEKKAEILLQLCPYFEAKKREVEYSVTKATFGHTDLSKLSLEEMKPLLPEAMKTLGYKIEEVEPSNEQMN